MAAVVLACKALVAVLLAAAGGAKLADVPGFAATVRLFLPASTKQALNRTCALAIAVGEIAIGAASLTSPQVGWLNLAVLAVCCGFAVVAVVGYLRYPGRACRCFGALSGRAFDLTGIGRAVLIVAGAWLAAVPVSRPVIELGPAARLGLLGGAALLAWAAYTAAAAIGAWRSTEPGLAR